MKAMYLALRALARPLAMVSRVRDLFDLLTPNTAHVSLQERLVQQRAALDHVIDARAQPNWPSDRVGGHQSADSSAHVAGTRR